MIIFDYMHTYMFSLFFTLYVCVCVYMEKSAKYITEINNLMK